MAMHRPASFDIGEFKHNIRNSNFEWFRSIQHSLTPDLVSVASFTLGEQMGEYHRSDLGGTEEEKQLALDKINYLADFHNFNHYEGSFTKSAYTVENKVNPEFSVKKSENGLLDWLGGKTDE